MNKKILIIPILLIIVAVIITVTIFAGNKTFTETQNIDVSKYEYFALCLKDGNVGVADKLGKVIVEPKYSDVYIPNPIKDVFVCFDDNDSIIINSKGEKLFEEYDDVSAIVTSEGNSLDFEKDVLKFRKNDLYGLIDYDGKIVLEAEYQDIKSVPNRPGRILIQKDDNYGVVDSKGETIIPTNYYSIKGDEYSSESEEYYRTGYIVSQKNSQGIMSGYIDYKGKKLLDNKFDSITRIFKDDSDIYLIAMNNGRKGVYKNNKEIIEPVYQDIVYSSGSNIIIAKRFDKYGFFNLEGRQILQNFYDNYEIAGKYISVEDNGKKSLFDINGNFIEQKNYSRIVEVENSDYIIAVDSQDNTYSIISKEVNIKNNYINVSFLFEDNFSFTNQDGKSGVVNVKKGEVIPAQYDLIIPVLGINCIEAKNEDGTSTFYSEKLEEIFTFSYPIVETLDDNCVIIYNNEEKIYLDKSGNVVDNSKISYKSNIYSFKDKNGLWGYLDKNGNTVIPAKYTIATEINEFGFGAIMLDNKWGVIDDKGNIVVEPTYELETYYYPKFIGKYKLEQIETTYLIEV